MDKNINTPRTLLRTMQNDASIEKDDIFKKETKDLIKSFLNADKSLSIEQKKILDHSSFDGYFPTIDDNVLKMERYPMNDRSSNLETTTKDHLNKEKTEENIKVTINKRINSNDSNKNSDVNKDSNTKINENIINKSIETKDLKEQFIHKTIPNTSLSEQKKNEMVAKIIKNINNIKTMDTKPRHSEFSYTSFERCLLFINMILFFGIIMTIVFIVSYFILLNNMLNINVVLS